MFRAISFEKNDFDRLYYALQWMDNSSKNSKWTIHHFQKDGHSIPIISGFGYQAYKNTADSLENVGVNRNQIMFGGKPMQSDSTRLGLSYPPTL